MRIPLEYLAGLFTAGDTAPVELALRRLAAMRSYMRDVFVDNPTNEEIPASVGMTPEKVKEMYRLLSIAKYDDRFVIPTAHPRDAARHQGARGAARCPTTSRPSTAWPRHVEPPDGWLVAGGTPDAPP